MTLARRRRRPPKPVPAPARPTQSYGLYFTDIGRPTRRGALISCPSDEDAVRWAEQHREGRPAELRSGERLVLRWSRGSADAEPGP